MRKLTINANRSDKAKLEKEIAEYAALAKAEYGRIGGALAKMAAKDWEGLFESCAANWEKHAIVTSGKAAILPARQMAKSPLSGEYGHSLDVAIDWTDKEVKGFCRLAASFTKKTDDCRVRVYRAGMSWSTPEISGRYGLCQGQSFAVSGDVLSLLVLALPRKIEATTSGMCKCKVGKNVLVWQSDDEDKEAFYFPPVEDDPVETGSAAVQQEVPAAESAPVPGPESKPEPAPESAPVPATEPEDPRYQSMTVYHPDRNVQRGASYFYLREPTEGFVSATIATLFDDRGYGSDSGEWYWFETGEDEPLSDDTLGWYASEVAQIIEARALAPSSVKSAPAVREAMPAVAEPVPVADVPPAAAQGHDWRIERDADGGGSTWVRAARGKRKEKRVPLPAWGVSCLDGANGNGRKIVQGIKTVEWIGARIAESDGPRWKGKLPVWSRAGLSTLCKALGGDPADWRCGPFRLCLRDRTVFAKQEG